MLNSKIVRLSDLGIIPTGKRPRNKLRLRLILGTGVECSMRGV